jgi:hypothetical protein
VITREFALERTRAAFHASPLANGPVDVGIYEFDLGFVVWPVGPPPTDWSRPPSTIGGSVLVIDLHTGQPSVWPRIAAPNVAELYRKSKQNNG